MAASAVTCALPPRGWGQGLAAAARSIRPSPQLRPPCCNWLRGGPAESVLANGRPREVRMLEVLLRRAFPGRGLRCRALGGPAFPGRGLGFRVRGAGVALGRSSRAFFFFFPFV